MDQVQVVAVGDVDPMLLKSVCAAVTEMLGNECRAGNTIPMPDFAYNARREQ